MHHSDSVYLLYHICHRSARDFFLERPSTLTRNLYIMSSVPQPRFAFRQHVHIERLRHRMGPRRKSPKLQATKAKYVLTDPTVSCPNALILSPTCGIVVFRFCLPKQSFEVPPRTPYSPCRILSANFIFPNSQTFNKPCSLNSIPLPPKGLS